VVDAILGGWQISAVNTMQGGTPFNITYSPNSANVVSPQISATYRGANEYRPNYVPGNSFVLCHGGHSCIAHLAANGTVNYVNLNAFHLPAIHSHFHNGFNANIASPFGNAPRNPSRTPNFFRDRP
jgi:hypothetical protein